MSARAARPERRYSVVLVLVLAVLAVYGVRLAYVQGIEGPSLAREALAQRLHSTEIDATRGEIVDSSGVVLATSAVSFDIILDQRQIPDYVDAPEVGEPSFGAVAAARRLAPILGEDVNELGARLVGENGYVRLARGVSPEIWQQVRELRINGVTPVLHSKCLVLLPKRIWPKNWVLNVKTWWWFP